MPVCLSLFAPLYFLGCFAFHSSPNMLTAVQSMVKRLASPQCKSASEADPYLLSPRKMFSSFVPLSKKEPFSSAGGNTEGKLLSHLRTRFKSSRLIFFPSR